MGGRFLAILAHVTWPRAEPLDHLCSIQIAYWAKKSCCYLNQGCTFHDILTLLASDWFRGFSEKNA